VSSVLRVLAIIASSSLGHRVTSFWATFIFCFIIFRVSASGFRARDIAKQVVQAGVCILYISESFNCYDFIRLSEPPSSVASPHRRAKADLDA